MVPLRGRPPAVGSAVCVLIFLLAVALLPAATAGTVETQVRVANRPPEILAWDVSLDPRLGVFVYSLEATDGNGVEDLTRIVVHIFDHDGKVQAHRDDAPALDARRAAVWNGLVIAERPTKGPFQVEVHVYDRLDAEANDDQPVFGLRPLTDVPKQAAPQPTKGLLRPLVGAIRSVEAPLPLVVPAVALLLSLAVGLVVLAAREQDSRRATRRRR